MAEQTKPIVHESDFPSLYLCPCCDAPVHFADGFVFCINCHFARPEDAVQIIREFPAVPIPSTKCWNPSPNYYCEACNNTLVEPYHATTHPDTMKTYAREYHFGCGGTHATFCIYPFQHLKKQKRKKLSYHTHTLNISW